MTEPLERGLRPLRMIEEEHPNRPPEAVRWWCTRCVRTTVTDSAKDPRTCSVCGEVRDYHLAVP